MNNKSLPESLNRECEKMDISINEMINRANEISIKIQEANEMCQEINQQMNHAREIIQIQKELQEETMQELRNRKIGCVIS